MLLFHILEMGINTKYLSLAMGMALLANGGQNNMFDLGGRASNGNACTGREHACPQQRRKSRKKKEYGAPNLTKKQRKQLKSK